MGLSEWIKVAGMFIGKEEEACQLFAQMEQRYNLLKAKVSNVKQRPSVFSGEMRRDTWYVPGGQSFYARLFADAGADYFMKVILKQEVYSWILKPYTPKDIMPATGE